MPRLFLRGAILLMTIGVAGCQDYEEAIEAGGGVATVELDTAAIQAAMSTFNAGVQAAMRTFIEGRMSADKNYSLNGVQSRFDSIHDGVSEKDGLFVSCVDFKAGEDVYDVDYYVKAENGAFTVVKELLHKKNGEAVDEVLWEE